MIATVDRVAPRPPRLPRRPLFDIIPAMKMNPSHRPCHLALAASPARSRTIDLRGNVTHTENLGSVPSRWLGGSVVRWLGSCANPQHETHTSRSENDGLVPKAPVLKYRIILGGRANIMQIACAVAGSVPKFSTVFGTDRKVNFCNGQITGSLFPPRLYEFRGE